MAKDDKALIARRLVMAGVVATAFAEGRFRKVSRDEAWEFGWDAQSESPEIFIEGECAAILNFDRTRIEITDENGDLFILDLENGEFIQA